jgi:hypothetical protein
MGRYSIPQLLFVLEFHIGTCQIYVIPIYIFPFFWLYVSLLRSVPALRNFHLEHWTRYRYFHQHKTKQYVHLLKEVSAIYLIYVIKTLKTCATDVRVLFNVMASGVKWGWWIVTVNHEGQIRENCVEKWENQCYDNSVSIAIPFQMSLFPL